MRSRASTSRASSLPETAAGSTPAPTSAFAMTFAAATLSAPAEIVSCQSRVEPAGHEHRRALEVELRLDPPDPGRRQLRKLAAQPLDELGGRLDRDQIRLREVAVVVRLLLLAVRRQRTGRGVEVVRLLLDRAAGLPHADLARDLRLDPARDEVERVHVLELRARAQLVRARRPDGDVRVHTQRPLLHLGVRDPELDDRLSEQLEEALRVLGGAEVRLGDDLDERRPAAVEVDERVVRAPDPPRAPADVHGLRRVLLEVRAHDPDLLVAVCARH